MWLGIHINIILLPLTLAFCKYLSAVVLIGQRLYIICILWSADNESVHMMKFLFSEKIVVYRAVDMAEISAVKIEQAGFNFTFMVRVFVIMA